MGSLIDRKGVGGGRQSTPGNATYGETFEVGLETDEIAIEAVDHESDILRYHGGIGHIGGWNFTALDRLEDGVGEWEDGEVSADVVGERVEPDLIFEPSGVDLEIVLWVTPTTESGRRVIPDTRVVDVMSVCVEVG